jgi:hypothetical protein
MIVKLTNLIFGAFGNRNPYPTPKRACLIALETNNPNPDI